MDHVVARGMRLGTAVLLVVALTSGVGRESAAQPTSSSDLPRQATVRSQPLATIPPLSPEHQAASGSMRYYGGPKSPMWRAPAAD
jgi:hypothetical protein